MTNTRSTQLQQSHTAGSRLPFSLSMTGLRQVLQNFVRKGTLTLIAPDGSVHHFGNGMPSVKIRITEWRVIRNLLLDPSLGIGEAYTAGALRIEDGDICDFLDFACANLGWGSAHWLHRVRTRAKTILQHFRRSNRISASRRNVAHHYNLSDALYELFLDQDRQYSCAYYRSAADSLEQAQEHKKHHIAAKMLLEKNQQVLDIGSGWGGLALALAREKQVDVTGITLSKEQHRFSECRASDAGLSHRVRFRLKDYREESGTYDRIVSVGMFEHVGLAHYREYFGKVRDLLREDGVALVHTIGRADGPGCANTWIEKYIFPGGYVPALSEILPAIERAGLYVADVEVLRLHYAETLKAWRERFIANRDRVLAIYDEKFCRMWEFYLASCEAAFRHCGLVVFQIQLCKRIDAIPVTRDYIYSTPC